jgi:uncharacterized protein YPO0396
MTLLEIQDWDETDAHLPSGPIHSGQWRLARVDVLNWGTFDGLHSIDVARKGHLFTGASGSGKSSLLDAIATVLTPDRWLRFNAAAQESTARNDDRSLVSYVRGAWSREADENMDRAVSTYLRPKPTWSGILLRYENGRDAPVTAVRLFHLRGSSVDKSDLRDTCFLDRGEVGLLDFRKFASAGIDVRRIKAAWPDAIVTQSGTHKPFYAKLRRLLGIGSENALHLLHKTQSAKNLGTLDQLFRSFMLDEPGTFARAENAVDQFGELSRAHEHVVELRHQVDQLRIVEESIVGYDAAATASSAAERLISLIEPFQNQYTVQLATNERGLLVTRRARAADAAHRAEATRTDAVERMFSAQRASQALGSADVDRLRERVAEAEKSATETTTRWKRFAEQLGSVDIDAPTTGESFAELRETSRASLAVASPQAAHDHDDSRTFFDARNEIARIDGEITELRKSRSNLPAELLRARKQLAQELGLSEAALPFAGELIEVRPSFAEWTGAIERVLSPLASALLVRDEYLADVRRRVERRNLGAHLVFEAVPVSSAPPRRARTERSLLYRIQVSKGPFEEWLTARVSEQFDYACVDHPDELDSVDKGVTLGGQVKKSARRYEKNDRYSVDDRTRWILGADNDLKIDLLLEQRRAAQKLFEGADARLQAAQTERYAVVRRHTVLTNVLEQEWEELDRAAAADRVRGLNRQLADLATGNAPLEEALAAEADALSYFEGCDAAWGDAKMELGELDRMLKDIADLLDDLATRVSNGAVSEADFAMLEARYRSDQRKIDRQTIDNIGRRVSDTLNREFRDAQNRLRAAESSFVAGASGFAARFPGAVGELTSHIGDRAGYLALLEGIVVRGLPEHEGNFLKLLRDRAGDLIAHLLSDIRDAPKQVEDRIDPVNASLGRSRFDVDRYLRVVVKVRRAPEVVAFMDDLKAVVDGSWDDEGLPAAEKRFAVLKSVMNRLGSSENADVAWRRRCLDTREHVTFMAHEVDLAGRTLAVHDSSAGLSGGQRQKLVIFCLAAALRYQLAEDEDRLPSYATIILDEAFDKADSRYTRMAMDVFIEFGFHMILATPEKLLQTIEPYVGGITSITNPTRKDSQHANLIFRADTDA